MSSSIVRIRRSGSREYQVNEDAWSDDASPCAEAERQLARGGRAGRRRLAANDEVRLVEGQQLRAIGDAAVSTW